MSAFLNTFRDGRGFESMLVFLTLGYLLVFSGFPLIYNLVMSFQEVDLFSLATFDRPWVGLDNYREVLGQPQSLAIIQNTGIFVVLSVAFQLSIGFALALFFQLDFPGNSYLRGLFLAGWIMPALVIGAVWSWILAGDFGVLNYILQGIGLTDERIFWLSDPSVSLYAVIIANIWLGVPFNMILLSVGLAAIPDDVYEAAALDGASRVWRFVTITLPLKGMSRAEARAKAAEIAQITGLGDLLERYPRELSGGQRQRVAMGRAIVRDPRAFLFDEPLSNLDAALRVHMRGEVRRLHDRLGATSVYVTHDQIEAMTMADHVVVMRAGVIEQQGPPLELYDRPVNRFVAGFIGSPAMNFLDATVTEAGDSLRLALPGRPELRFSGRRPAGESVTVGLRPEHLLVAPEARENRLDLPVGLIERTGSASYVVAETDPEVIVLASDRLEGMEGETIPLTIAPERVHLFAPDTGETLVR